MGRTSTDKYLVYWDTNDTELCHGLKSALEVAASRYNNSNIYAILDNDTMVLLK